MARGFPLAMAAAWVAAPLLVQAAVESNQLPLHHKCTVPEDKSDWKLAESWCTACYLETLAALPKVPGADMVIGANDGRSFDPAWEFGYWKKSPHHTIVWVEPNPILFKKLEGNTADIANKVLLNKAVRPLTMTEETLSLICWNTTMVADVLENRMPNPLPKEIGPVKSHWNALCSLDVKNLEQASDVWTAMAKFKTDDGQKLSKERMNEIMDDVRAKWQVAYTVPARLPKQLIQDAQVPPASIRYLQIDVEGLDNEIIRALPFGEDGFAPTLILYENHQGYDVKSYLEERGYFVCCCLKQWGSNIVAVKVPGGNFTKSPYRPDRRFGYRVPTEEQMKKITT